MELPYYEIVINNDDAEDTEVTYVALVDEPAIRKRWIWFDKHEKFSVTSEEERIVSGPIMVADMPIYRRCPDRGEFYVVFNAATIKQIVQKFFKRGSQGNVNLMHDPKAKVDGAYMFESWLVDSAKGKPPLPGYEDVSEGSWFGSFKVEDDVVWDCVKDGTFAGFSVEGIFNMSTLAVKTKEQEFLDSLNELYTKLSKEILK